MNNILAFVIHRRIGRILIAATVVCLVSSHTAYAQAQTVRFEFRPHCETADMCPSFDIRDPQSLHTPMLKVGDSLDMDLIIRNPEKKPVKRFRAWIAYDPTLLKGEEISIMDSYPVPAPGEEEFYENEGFAKVSGSTQTSMADELIVVARIRFTIVSVRDAGTPITFYDNADTDDSETGIFSETGTQEENIISRNPGYLFVRMQESAHSSSIASSQQNSSSIASIAQTGSAVSASSSASSLAVTTIFTMLQVQGLRLTTEGSTVFLAWDALPSSELVGYNVYYGTVSGRYVQRRAVDKASISLSIRALPVGTTYYFALRGVNDKGQETEFSQEVGVSVGNPKTSTSPLVAGTIPPITPKTNGDITGDTGIPSTIALFTILSAAIGTFLAFRRQLNASITTHA